MELEKKELEEAKKKAKQNSIFGFLENFTGGKSKGEDQGSIEFSLAGLFKCMCCVTPKPSDKMELTRIADTLGGVKRRLENIERYGKRKCPIGVTRNAFIHFSFAELLIHLDS